MNATRNRRAFLRGIGASVAALPFLRLVENSYAQSDGEQLPQRFPGMPPARFWRIALRCNGRGFSCGATAILEWWMDFSCPPQRSR